VIGRGLGRAWRRLLSGHFRHPRYAQIADQFGVPVWLSSVDIGDSFRMRAVKETATGRCWLHLIWECLDTWTFRHAAGVPGMA